MAKSKKPKPGSMAELAEIFPPIQAIDVRLERIEGKGKDAKLYYDHETVFVKPLAVEQLGAFAAALAPIGAVGDLAGDWLLFAAKHQAEVIAAVAVAIEWNPKNVGKMHAADFIEVVSAVMVANQDFLTRLLGSLVFAGLAMRGAGTNGAGLTPSDTSESTAASASQKSSH